MESSHLNGHEIVRDSHYGSILQVSDESGLLCQNSISEDEASVSEFEEEDDIANKDDYVQTEEVVALEENKVNEKKDELCIGMEFSSDEAAYIAYKQYGGNHGFNVRKQRRTKKQEKVVRLLYVCSKQGYRKEPKWLCANEDAFHLLKKLEGKKKELVKANAWMPRSSDVALVEEEEEEEEEDKEVPNARGIKRKAPVGRPKNKKVGLHGRYLGVLETKNRRTSKSSSHATAKKQLSFQDSTDTLDTQLSVATTTRNLHNESSLSQLLQEFDKSRGGP
ncbi:unnamed protein product [Arabidopsis lyrata]|nr:unnamed protein product [Arabidopsis lyrata]